MDNQPRVLHLDIISDVICPWCFIGKRKLDAALGELEDLRVNLIWRPFQLDPTTPPDGYDRRKEMEKKFGADGARKLA
ncbi:MAG TPA: disulfide bond formation protein DsbA, partial [Rhodobiaceae bacterium]|nr:disulfide bond formation protein DsbA [Rhodobiaceae bacterium]